MAADILAAPDRVHAATAGDRVVWRDRESVTTTVTGNGVVGHTDPRSGENG